jgi:hypothetical protein
LTDQDNKRKPARSGSVMKEQTYFHINMWIRREGETKEIKDERK